MIKGAGCARLFRRPDSSVQRCVRIGVLAAQPSWEQSPEKLSGPEAAGRRGPGRTPLQSSATASETVIISNPYPV